MQPPPVPFPRPGVGGHPESWTVQDTFRDLPMDAVTLLENVLDVSHVPFTHHRPLASGRMRHPLSRVPMKGRRV